MKRLPATVFGAFLFLALSSSLHAVQVLDMQFEGNLTDNAAGAGSQDGTSVNGAAFSGTNISAATPGSGSLSLDGSNDYVSLGNPGSLLQAASGFTISAFIRVDAMPGTNTYDTVVLVSTGSSVSSGRAALQFGNNGGFAIGGRRADGDSLARYASASGLISIGQTYHIAGTVDFSSGTAVIHLYLNGVEVANTLAPSASAFSGGSAISNTASQAAYIGANGGGNSGAGSEFTDGLIDDVRIYNTALSASEVAALAVPEPGAGVLLALATGGLLIRRRR